LLAISYDFQGLRALGSQAAYPDAQSFFARLQAYYGADHVPFFRPEVQDTAAVLGGDGVTGGRHLEEQATVFEEGGTRMVGEELLQKTGQLGGGEFRHLRVRSGRDEQLNVLP
jgi:hypothetical protein